MKGRRYPFSRDLQNIVLKLSGSLIIQLGKCIVAPPSIIGRIIWEPVIVMETEVIMIWTVFLNIRALLIAGLVFINPLPIKPLIEGTAMIEYTVQNYPYSTFMGFLNDLDQ